MKRPVRTPLVAVVSLIGMATAVPAWAQSTPYCFVPTDDAFISMHNPDANTGNSTMLQIRNKIGSSAHNDDFQIDTLVKFDLTTMPEELGVNRATLYLYYFEWFDNDPGARTLAVHRLVEDWDEATVTWNLQPARDLTQSATCPVPNVLGRWIAFDVTADVQLFLSGVEPNFGWAVTDPVPWGSANIPYTRCHSMENEQLVPYLLLETSCMADFDGSGDIGFADLTLLLSLWGACP